MKLLAVLSMILAGPAAAQVFYATDAASGDDNWRLDIASGMSAGPVWTGTGATGLADDDGAQVYYACFGSTLWTADYAAAGAGATQLGTMTYQGVARSFTGLAADAGVLYASHNAANGAEGLYSIDVVTFVATLSYTYTDQEIALEGLDFDPATGMLYGANDGGAYVDPNGAWGRGIVTIDFATMPPTEQLTFGYPSGVTDVDGLAYDPAGWVYLLEDEPAPLHRMDALTGTYDPTPATNAIAAPQVFSAGTYTEGTLPGLGSNYCTPATNSTGGTASMSAQGSSSVAANNVTLEASGLPNNAFGFFLTSDTQGLVMNPGGSQGNLCVVGNIGRYVAPGQIQNSGSSGMISLAIDLTQHPTPTGLISVQAGETWNFTAWFRDTAGGVATSNFADGLEVLFN